MNVAAATITSKTATFTADATAPTGVQPTPLSSLANPSSQYVFTNVGALFVFVAFGATAALAASGAVVPTGTQQEGFWLLPYSQATLTAPAGKPFVSGIASGPSIVYVTGVDGL